jgi:chemotaxis protein CheD
MKESASKFNPAVLTADAMKGFEQPEAGNSRHFLYPGQVFVTRDRMVISTILGSCAAVCLWDNVKRAGGMNHYLLPDGPSDGENRLRYGNVANPELLSRIRAMGCEVRNLKAKIFGGSSAFSVDTSNSVGSRNVELAESFLRSAGIPVVEKEVSGKHGRRLVFQVADGVTTIKSFE